MAHSLTAQFHGLDLNIIDHAGQSWLTAEQVGLALGYSDTKARTGITNLYNRHLDEFTEQDTCAIKLMAQGQRRDVRVFSQTGCHLLSFFANTPRAKEFRAWAKQALTERQLPLAPAGGKRPRINRTVERLAMERFVAGESLKEISQALEVSKATLSLILNAKWQFASNAGEPECSPELLDAVARQHLLLEHEKLQRQQQRMMQKFTHYANNRELAERMDAIGQQLRLVTMSEIKE